MNKDMGIKMDKLALLEREYFEKLMTYLFKLQKAKEHFFVNLGAEQSQFVRLNGAKIRQIGTVDDATLEITMVIEAAPGKLQKGSRSVTLCGLSYEDQSRVQEAIEILRAEVLQLPIDPYTHLPSGDQTSSNEKFSKTLKPEQASSEIMEPIQTVDLAGIYASGSMVRAMASSSGQRHWFLTENFSLDYSLYTSSQRALKGTFAGAHWNRDEFRKQIGSSQEKLAILEREPRKIARGSYRCYLAPAAVTDLIHMFNWGCISEASIQQGDSPLRKVRSGERTFSPRFSLSEDFSRGEVPRFNLEGELSNEKVPLIEGGKLVGTLVSSRTSKEYGIASNQASSAETMRAPSVAPGMLDEAHILKKLGTGLYLSNLHYLNWSDQTGGRITGMTRYACFWVENGQIVAPIENMRFDESLFNLFGESLEDLTRSQTYIPEVGTYFSRSIGGVWTPGMLVSSMSFTL